jgi:hypothetical protein
MGESHKFALMVKRGAVKLEAVPPHLRTRVARMARDLTERDLKESVAGDELKAPGGTGYPGAIRRARSV